MPYESKRYKIRFDDQEMQFEENFPTGLAGHLFPEEFDAIIKKINTDFNQELIQATTEFRRWSKIWIVAAFTGIGLVITPVLSSKAKRQSKLLKEFWEAIRIHLGQWNRERFQKRRLEWKLVEEQQKIKGRDVVNPLYAYRIDIIQKFGRPKKTDDVGVNKKAFVLPSNVEDTFGGGTTADGGERGSMTGEGSVSKKKRVSFVDETGDVVATVGITPLIPLFVSEKEDEHDEMQTISKEAAETEESAKETVESGESDTVAPSYEEDTSSVLERPSSGLITLEPIVEEEADSVMMAPPSIPDDGDSEGELIVPTMEPVPEDEDLGSSGSSVIIPQ